MHALVHRLPAAMSTPGCSLSSRVCNWAFPLSHQLQAAAVYCEFAAMQVAACGKVQRHCLPHAAPCTGRLTPVACGATPKFGPRLPFQPKTAHSVRTLASPGIPQACRRAAGIAAAAAEADISTLSDAEPDSKCRFILLQFVLLDCISYVCTDRPG